MDARQIGRSSPRTGDSPADCAASDVAIRPAHTRSEFQACVALQRQVWGRGFSEAVPASLLQAASYVGGLVVGAFDGHGTMLGFVFGITGVRDGRVVHWSHLLGVIASARNHGIGRRLKEYQRLELARHGIAEMLWTFDPLLAKNAHLNLNLLGARVVQFTPDMYGPTVTPLHHGLPTDRFLVACDTAGQPTAREGSKSEAAGAPLLTLEPRAGDELADPRHPPARIRLEIPTDFQQLLATSAARAAEWHANVRAHLQWALAHGYDVTALLRDVPTSRSFYLLTAAMAAD